MSESKNTGPARVDPAELVLREGLKANVLSPEAMQRIRQATEQEWRSATRLAPPRRGWQALAAAAAALILSAGFGIAYVAMNSGTGGAILGELTSFDTPGMSETRRFRPDVPFGEGAKLRVGQMLEVRGDSLVTLAGGGNLRVARASVIRVQANDVVSLERGELYVDIPPDTKTGGTFRVVTDAGEFRHEGTQFAVALVEGQTRLRVREGRVLWRARSGDSAVHAGTELVIGKNGRASSRPIATAGRHWAWMESMMPAMAIEDRPLIEFLEWFARETGRRLVIDDATRRQAAGIRMHGNVRGLTVTEALSAVMATTSLRYELPEGVIRVSSPGASKPPSV